MSNIIPVSLTSLIGREQEIETLCQLLHRPDIRLVTITGLGGVGKMSLALQVAHELSDAFHEGVFFISLALILDPTLIIPTIARLLDVTESPNRLLLYSLKDFLRDKQMLLLLDNLEQIIAAAPTTPMTHISIVEHEPGQSADWMEHVSDEQYQARSGND